MYRLCADGKWIDFKTAATMGACSGAGKMDWDGANTVYKFCDGTNYIKITPTCSPTSLTYKTRVTDATKLASAGSIIFAPGEQKAYVLGNYSQYVNVYDLTGGVSAPSLLGSSAAISYINDSSCTGAVQFGNYIYVVSRGNDNLVSINVSTDTPTYVSRIQASPTNQMNNIWSADVTGDGRYIATISWFSGASNKCYLHMIDANNPASMSVAASVDLSAVNGGYVYCNVIRIRGNVAYITDGGGAVYTVDVTNPAAPSYLGKVTNASYSNIYPFDILGNYLFALTFSGNYFQVINITTPSAPTHVTNYTNANHNGSYGVTIQGNYAFTAAEMANSYSIVNISNPSSPSHVSTLTDATNLQGAETPLVRGRYLWSTVKTNSSFALMDIGCDPAASATLGACSTAGRIEYFPTARALAYCDGSNYQMMAQARVKPRKMDWPNFSGTSAVRALIGISSSIDVQISAVNGTGSPTLEYRINNGSWIGFTTGSPATASVNVWDKLDFRVTGTSGHSATFTVTNLSDANAVLDTAVGTVP